MSEFETILQIVDKGSTIAVLLYLLWAERKRAEVAETYIRSQHEKNADDLRDAARINRGVSGK